MRISVRLQGRNQPAYEVMDLLSRSEIGSVSGIKSETELQEVGCDYIYSCTWKLSLVETSQLGLPPKIREICQALKNNRGWHISTPPSFSSLWDIYVRCPAPLHRLGLTPQKYRGPAYTFWRATVEAPYWGLQGESPTSRIFGRGARDVVEILYITR